MLIVFEGSDGSGTTTHSRLLYEALIQRNKKVYWTCQPTKGVIGSFIRDVFEGRHGDTLPPWRAMTMLFQADREVNRIDIAKLLENGFIVICDRYWLSGLAYQSTSAEEEGDNQDEAMLWITQLNEGMLLPDLTIILEVPVEVALGRKERESSDLFEKKGFLERVNKVYANVRGGNIVRVDSNRPTAEVFKDVADTVEEVLGR